MNPRAQVHFFKALYSIISATYYFICKPFVASSIEQLKHDINNAPSEEQPKASQHSAILSFLRTHKTATLVTCDVATELVLPLADFYVLKFAVIDRIPPLLNVPRMNAFLQKPLVVASTPVLFRGAHVLLEQNSHCISKNISTVVDTSLRASEFTAWYYLFSSGLTLIIPNKTPLGLTTKLASIYTIRFLDRVESRFLEHTDEPLFDSKFLLLPLAKSPITTTCKFAVAMYIPQSKATLALEALCNFAGELSYVQAEHYMSHNALIPLDNATTNYRQNFYLLSKSIWKTTHQNFEKSLTSPEILGKPLGHRTVGLFAPRNHMVESLKNFFKATDSSEYLDLDPDLVELCSLMCVSPTSIKSTNAFLQTAALEGKCPSLPDLKDRILNITNNFWGQKVETAEIIPCTAARFYSNYNHVHGMFYYTTSTDTLVPSLNPSIPMNFADINSMTKQALNYSASECFTEHMAKESQWSIFNFFSGLTSLFGYEAE